MPSQGMTTKSFTETVYDIVKRIPMGCVLTYGDVAKLAGSPGAARAVGTIMKQNPFAPVVPCHRVIKADGTAGQFNQEGGEQKKLQLLRDEGVTANDLRVHRWEIIY